MKLLRNLSVSIQMLPDVGRGNKRLGMVKRVLDEDELLSMQTWIKVCSITREIALISCQVFSEVFTLALKPHSIHSFILLFHQTHEDWLGKLPQTLEYPQEDEKSPTFHNRDKKCIVPPEFKGGTAALSSQWPW